MTASIRPNVGSRIWGPANPFHSFKRPPRHSPNNRAPSPTTKRAYSHSRAQPRFSSLRKKSVVKSFAPSGLFFVDISPSTTATSSTISSCTTSIEKTLYATTSLPRQSITSLAQQAWRRDIHSSVRRRERGPSTRNTKSTSKSHNVRDHEDKKIASAVTPTKKPSESTDSSPMSYLNLPNMPKMPHRPTKDELLAAATGFWSRLKVRFKWFSIRSVRPFNSDDWGAFVSWFVLCNIVWLFIGTTTFLSLVIFSINTVVAQGR